MWLNDLWFALFVTIIAGYLVLDGFDIGVGILYPFASRDDTERRLALNSIGPIWDGNEVWLVVGGGVLFAAFPVVYAALFSGFYGAMMLVLLCLILRAVAIEFRGKRAGAGWRRTWDATFFLSSLVLALLLGVAIGNVVMGVPVNASGDVVIGSLLDLLHPLDLLFGVTTFVVLTLYGALYLNLKTEGAIRARARRWTPALAAASLAVAVVTAVWMVAAGTAVAGTYVDHPWLVVVPLAAAAAFAATLVLLSRGRDAGGFFAAAAALALLLGSIAVGMYPNVLPSTIDPSYSMTVTNAAADTATLTVMLVITVIGLPFVLLYTAGVQYLFRGKVELTENSY